MDPNQNCSLNCGKNMIEYNGSCTCITGFRIDLRTSSCQSKNSSRFVQNSIPLISSYLEKIRYNLRMDNNNGLEIIILHSSSLIF